MHVQLRELLFALSRALDFVERELLGVTSNHGKRTAYVCTRISRAMGFDDSDLFDMAGCAILHDNALTAYMSDAGHGKLSRLEHFEHHCTLGEKNAMDFPFIGDCTGIVQYHHENWNGSGFFHLKGHDIPLRAQILRLADNMDLCLAMMDGRVGLAGEIREHVEALRGRLYAPDVVDALLAILDDDILCDLRDDRIHQALPQSVPDIRVNLSTQQLLRLCRAFAFIVDAKSPFTRSHTSGVAERTGRLADAYGFAGEHRDTMLVAAYFHDIGKLSTPASILEKDGPLTQEEFEVMRDHVAVTRDILAEVAGLEDITVWASSHHEKLNGKGYPDGVTGEALPLEARIISCCDIYQALTEDRPYREGMGHLKAMKILRTMADNGELDAGIVNTVDGSFATA